MTKIGNVGGNEPLNKTQQNEEIKQNKKQEKNLNLDSLFNIMDKNQDGKISKKEVKEYFKENQIDESKKDKNNIREFLNNLKKLGIPSTTKEQILKETHDSLTNEIEAKDKFQKEVQMLVNLELYSQAKSKGINVDSIINNVINSYKGETTDDESINLATKEILAQHAEKEIVKALKEKQQAD